MTVDFHKSLDRPIDVLGIKGKWLTLFLVMAGISVFVAIVVGSMTSSGIGISVAIILVAGSFITCLMLQGKVSYRQLYKYKAAGKMYKCVIRRETLCRILLTDPDYEASHKENNVKP